MNPNLRKSFTVIVILTFLLSFAGAETVAAQSVFGRIKRNAKRIKRARSAVKTVKKAADSPAKAIAPNAVKGNDSAVSLPVYGSENTDRQIAAAFAPVFHQGLGSSPRFDYITNFDFDGDWRGDNNWANAGKTKFPLRAYVYYSVAETATHYFVSYAVFHPRDYKGGNVGGRILSRAIEAGIDKFGRYDPLGISDGATLAHENDLEGCLIIAEKRGNRLQDARVRYVETLAHNRFLKYEPRPDTTRNGIGRVRLSGRRAELFIEPRGHGIESRQPGKTNKRVEEVLVYRYTGRAGDSSKRRGGASVGYALAPIYTTLWARAQAGENQTYAEAHDYRELLTAASRGNGRSAIPPKIGSAFRGAIGGTNMARPPWGWFDGRERSRPLGEWFFDPAETVKRHFKPDASFSTVYTHAPVLGITR